MARNFGTGRADRKKPGSVKSRVEEGSQPEADDAFIASPSLDPKLPPFAHCV
jgi:hypothetical protein